MKISKTLVLGALLSATVGGGFAIAQPGGGGARMGERGPGRRLERMKTTLKLSSAQVTKLTKIMDDNRKEMEALRKKTDTRISAVLTADQRKKLADMKARGPQMGGGGGMGRGR